MKRITHDHALLDSRQQQQPFTATDTWRVFRIMAEFVEGFEVMSQVGLGVALFGSSRMKPEDPDYQAAVQVAEKLARHGLPVLSGGGPGIMEAANKGASQGGGLSVGLNIELPREQIPNPYQNVSLDFHYFFVRKMIFVKYALGFIIFPGGFGTMDEFFEALTLVQTKTILDFPLILFNRAYWEGLVNWLRETMLARSCIAPEDLSLFHLTDDPEEAVRQVVESEVVQGYLQGALAR